jgi:hypothetical protein
MPAAVTLLLPERARLAGGSLAPPVARAFGRADAVPGDEPGRRAQLQRHFRLLPCGWPVAALTRSVDAADAAGPRWLRADPAWVRPEINGARLFAVGEGLRLRHEDAGALLPALRALFGDAGFTIDAPDPSRWYLRLPEGTPLPTFPDPDDALGTDLFDALVGSDAARDAVARRWRTLLSEAQVVLHNHPWNERRVAAGLPPVNSLWFWGGGRLPDHVSTGVARVLGGDALLRALAVQAGVRWLERGNEFAVAGEDCLVDLEGTRELGGLCEGWLLPAIEALGRGALRELRLDFADGAGCVLLRAQRWRVWRKAATGFSGLSPLLQVPSRG